MVRLGISQVSVGIGVGYGMMLRLGLGSRHLGLCCSHNQMFTMRGRTRSVHDHVRTGVDDFGTVQFWYTRYVVIQPIVPYCFGTRGWTISVVFGT